MNTQKKQTGLVLGVGLILSALRTVLIAYTMEKNSVESDAYYLPDGNVFVIAFAIVAILFSLFIAFMALSAGKRIVTLDHKSGTAPASLVLGFLLIGVSIIYAVSSEQAKIEGGALMKLVVLFAVLSAVAFIIIGFRSNSPETSKNLLAWLTVLPIIFSACRLLADFISSSATPHASSGIYHILGLSAALLYFLSEGKSYVTDCHSRVYLFFGYFSIFLLLVYAVPSLILHCFGVFMFDYKAGFSAVDIGIAIYISTRIVTAKFNKKAVTESTASAE